MTYEEYLSNSFGEEEFLSHHGILGQKWGVRRYQNYDGSYTKKGLERYNRIKKVEEARQNYRGAVKNLKEVSKTGLLASRTVAESKAWKNRSEKIREAEKAVRDARIEYNKEKKGGSEEAYRKALIKELSRYGLPDSYKDVASGYKSSELLNDITEKHGEEFANSILKKTSNRMFAEIASLGVLSAGLFAVSIYLSDY